ncbi:MAG TPA: sigma-54 dependent transcriptional regulator [bacterium]|nr:sigma-54 dependent transcriptional regulator [bacterium]HPN31231.1 sigma-54 dependent transcriptional regulator [bacterium]
MRGNQKSNILIVEDDKNIVDIIESVLRKYYDVFSCSCLKDARKLITDNYFDAIILDVNLPDGNGITFITEIQKIFDNIVIIMATANNNVRDAIEAMKKGADDYLIKPYNLDELKIVLEKCLENKNLKKRVEILETEVDYLMPRKEIIGESLSLKKVFDKLKAVYEKDVTVLIRGSSGTGKELIARDIYYNSDRRKKPFVAVNCAAIPDTLIENELFGHLKGSFTGAYGFQRGKFEIAADGIIFLDEIGSLSMNAQVKLLRVIQEKKIMRIGDSKEISCAARVLAATSVNLENAVKRGLFREDLYYRLNVFPVFLPDLKERKEDIPVLTDYFIKQFNKKYNLNINGISRKLLDILIGYNWKGNIRELENTIEQMCLLCEEPGLTESIITKGKPFERLLMKETQEFDCISVPSNLNIEECWKIIIGHHLKKNNNNITQTAEKLGITRKTLGQKIKFYKLRSNGNE